MPLFAGIGAGAVIVLAGGAFGLSKLLGGEPPAPVATPAPLAAFTAKAPPPTRVVEPTPESTPELATPEPATTARTAPTPAPSIARITPAPTPEIARATPTPVIARATPTPTPVVAKATPTPAPSVAKATPTLAIAKATPTPAPTVKPAPTATQVAMVATPKPAATSSFLDSAATPPPSAKSTAGARFGANPNVDMRDPRYQQLESGHKLLDAWKTDEAVKVYKKIVKANDTFADGHYWFAYGSALQGETERACKEFNRYLVLAPSGYYSKNAKVQVKNCN